MRIISFLSGLFVADVQYNRAVGIVGRLRARAVGRAKSVNAGSLRVGDALKRYGDSRRPGVVQLSPRPRGLGGRGTAMQPLRGSRRAVRLEEQYGRNRCKVNDRSISPQREAIPHLGDAPDNSRDPAADESKNAYLIGDLLRQDRSYRSQMPGSAGRCAKSAWADTYPGLRTGFKPAL